MRVAVVGAGAIGGFIAGALARSGADVGVVARGAHLHAIQKSGLVVISELGSFTAELPSSDDLAKLPVPDVILITLKAHQLAAMLPQFARFKGTSTLIVPMINGVPFWYFQDRWLESVDPGGRLLGAFEYGQIIGAVVHASGHLPQPGTVKQSGGFLYPLGELDGRITPRLRTLSELFTHAGLQAPPVADIRREVWRKLLGNVCLNPVSALTRSTIGSMFADSNTSELIRSLMEECTALARAVGIDVGISIEDRMKHAGRLVDVKTSMLQDLEAGRPLEIEPIVGAVVELARQYGIENPRTRVIYALVRALAKNLQDPC